MKLITKNEDDTMSTNILIVPGLGNSGENHWQTHWLTLFENAVRVVQDDWDAPQRDQWLERLNAAVVTCKGPVVLVAHSLAVALVAHWAGTYDTAHIRGALLVAPADVDSPLHTPDVVRAFAPIPTHKLPFPSVVVASDNDPFVALGRAKYFAAQWGSEFVNIGAKGHINAESHLEFWEEGQLILQKLSTTASL